MLVGVLLHRFGSVDEYDLQGRGRKLPLVGILFALGGLLLAGFPFATSFFGKSLLEAAALHADYPWLPAVFVFASMFTGGAVLRVAGRVFMGWGEPESRRPPRAPGREEQDEEPRARGRTPIMMVLIPGVLLVGAIAVGLIPGAVPGIERATAHFRDQAAYITWVLHLGHARLGPAPTSHLETFDYLYGAGAALGAVALAALALFGHRRLQQVPDALVRPAATALTGLRQLHSGHIGDYIAWWTAAAGALGSVSLLLLT